MPRQLDPATRDYGLKLLICLVLATAAWAFQAMLLPAPVPLLVPSILLAGGLFLGFFAETTLPIRHGPLLKRAVGFCLVGLAIWISRPAPPEADMPWVDYSAAALDRARLEKKPVLIYFHADWCGPCHVFERGTLSRKIVVAATRDFLVLRADMTDQQSPAVAALAEKFGVIAYPTIVFIGADGEERRMLRLLGVESAERFIKRIGAVRD